MFQPKGFTVFILFLVSQFCYGQYDGMNGETTETRQSVPLQKTSKNNNDTLIDDYEEKPSIMDIISVYKGIEIATNGSQNLLFLSLDPQAGVSLNERLFLGGGVNLAINNASAMGGVFGFSRLSINKIFFQAEYRSVNTFLIEEQKRGWVSSPIVMVGFVYGEDMASWASIGLSTNSEFSRNMPFGALIYRFGIRF